MPQVQAPNKKDPSEKNSMLCGTMGLLDLHFGHPLGAGSPGLA